MWAVKLCCNIVHWPITRRLAVNWLLRRYIMEYCQKVDWLIDSVKVERLTRHRIGHSGDAVPRERVDKLCYVGDTWWQWSEVYSMIFWYCVGINVNLCLVYVEVCTGHHKSDAWAVAASSEAAVWYWLNTVVCRWVFDYYMIDESQYSCSVADWQLKIA